MSTISPQRIRKNDTDFKVKVLVRVRPSSEPPVVTINGPQILIPPQRSFTYDQCFGPDATQTQIYDQFGKEMVQHSLEGYNACIFAYGQTGSGKSHTMLGTPQDPGLIPQICSELFKFTETVQDTTAVTIRMSFLEIYNEQIRDLLTSSNQPLKVRGTGGEDCFVEGLSEYNVTSVNEVLNFLSKGAKTRATASTKMNDQSSRSHAVVSLTIKQQVVNPPSNTEGDNTSTKEKHSIIRLVDLAGSERANSSGATGERLKEGSNINKSLVTLGRVISTLADKTRESSMTVVPYRESILTRLLQNSLGGNSRTSMIACVAPDASNQDQTISTLRYADQAKRITNKARINQDLVTSKAQAERFATMQLELNELRQQLAEKSASNNDTKLTKLVQFYEDEAAREKVKSRMLEIQKNSAEKRNEQISDFLLEVTGRGISSIDTKDTRSYESLVEEQDKLLKDIEQAKEQISTASEKWSKLAATI